MESDNLPANTVTTPDDGTRYPSSVGKTVVESVKANPTTTKPQRGKAMLAYFTVQHARNPFCNHKVDLSRTPSHRNCQHCWSLLLNNVTSVADAAQGIFEKEGEQALREAQGYKFVKFFKVFLQEREWADSQQ